MIKKIKQSFTLLSTLLIVSTISCNIIYSQDSTYRTLKPVFAHASLLYDFPHSYGFATGVNYPYVSIIENRTLKSGAVSIRQKDRFWGVDVAAYRYPYNHTGILFVPFIGVRHNANAHFFYETSFGIGALRTFYDGKVYAVDASGNVIEKPLFGRFYATTYLSSAFNFLLKKLGRKVLALQLKPSIWFQYPFESFIKPHIGLQGGIKYEISKRGVKARTTTKHSRK